MSFNRLPAEILQKIFDYLPWAEQLQKTGISRRWNQLALKETYLILAYGEQVISERLLRRTQRGYCCFSIEFSEPYELLRPRLAICAEKFFLRKLILDGIQTYALVSFIGEFRQWLRSAVHFSVTMTNRVLSGDMKEQLDLPRLRILSWTIMTEDGNPCLPLFALNAPLLKDAYIECGDVERTPLILENTSNLKSLGIFVPKLIPAMCPNGLESLESLRIYNTTTPFAWDLKQCGLPRLTVLELCDCTVTNESIACLRNFPNLENLVIQTETSNLIDLHVIANSVPKLKELRLFHVRWTYRQEALIFPYLQVLDLNDTEPAGVEHLEQHHTLEITAPYLMTLKGSCLNLCSFNLTDHSTVKSMIVYGLYLNFLRPRLFESVMILYMDIPCSQAQPMITECIHQFPNLTRLTMVLHQKQLPVNLNGYLLAISFVRLRYLHLWNFDLDYNFLCGIWKSNSLRTLILQDGTLRVSPQDTELHFDDLQHFFVKNVKLPKDVPEFPVSYPPAKLTLSLTDGNVFSTDRWDEHIIKSREDYVTYLRF